MTVLLSQIGTSLRIKGITLPNGKPAILKLLQELTAEAVLVPSRRGEILKLAHDTIEMQQAQIDSLKRVCQQLQNQLDYYKELCETRHGQIDQLMKAMRRTD